MAAVFPYLRGGERETWRSGNQISIPTADCTAYDVAGTSSSALSAHYVMPDGELAYFAGREDPYVTVYRFGRGAASDRMMNKIEGRIADCEGRHSEDGLTVVRHVRPVPDLGDRALGYEETLKGFRPNKKDDDHFFVVWIRSGRYLAVATVQNDPAPPQRERAVAFARRAVRALG